MFTFSLPELVVALVLLLIRVLLAVTFFSEARFKLKDIKKFAKNDGIPVPVGYFVAFAELAAALGMLTGVLAQWAGLGIMVLMVGTICLHVFKWHSPYWANKRGWEYDLLLFTFAAVIVAFGPGSFTVFGL